MVGESTYARHRVVLVADNAEALHHQRHMLASAKDDEVRLVVTGCARGTVNIYMTCMNVQRPID